MSSSKECDEIQSCEALPSEIRKICTNELEGGNDELEDKDVECEDLVHLEEEPINDNNVTKLQEDMKQQLPESSLSATSIGDSDRSQQMSLAWMPPEILLLIFSYIDAKELVNSVMLTCKYFNQLIDNEKFWRSRHAQKWSNQYPALKVDKYPYWKETCVERETYHELFGNNAKNMKCILLSNGHYAAVDTVGFMQNGRLATSGGRDRSVCVWRVDGVAGNLPSTSPLTSKLDAHKGWIWCSQPLDDQRLYTGSWDTTVKLWDVEALEALSTLQCRSSVLSMSVAQDVVSVGTFFKAVLCFDLRSGHNIVNEFKTNGAVICMTENDRNIITGTDRGLLTVYCKRTGKLRRINWPKNNYPASITYGQNGELWVGDKYNNIHLVDTRGDTFTALCKGSLSPNTDDLRSKIHCMKYQRGVLAASTLTDVHILDAGRPPLQISTLKGQCDDRVGEINSLDLHENKLICGSRGPIMLWVPKSGDGESDL